MGGLYYANQTPVPVWGTKVGTSPTEITLESTYQAESGNTVATKTLKCGGYSKMNLDISYTMGATESTNSIEIRIEASPEGTNWYQIANDSTSGGTSTLTQREFTFVGSNAATTTIGIGIDIFYKYVRLAAKETGVSSNKGTIYCEVTLSGR